MQDGELFKETISANHTDDWVSLEYSQPDNMHVTHVMDFKQVGRGLGGVVRGI